MFILCVDRTRKFPDSLIKTLINVAGVLNWTPIRLSNIKTVDDFIERQGKALTLEMKACSHIECTRKLYYPRGACFWRIAYRLYIPKPRRTRSINSHTFLKKVQGSHKSILEFTSKSTFVDSQVKHFEKQLPVWKPYEFGGLQQQAYDVIASHDAIMLPRIEILPLTVSFGVEFNSFALWRFPLNNYKLVLCIAYLPALYCDRVKVLPKYYFCLNFRANCNLYESFLIIS